MPRLFILCGPSGTGKSVLLKRLFLKHGNKFGFSVSHTSRKPREGEIDGAHYHFTSKAVLLDMINQNKFLEHAEYSGNIYGTSFDAVQAVLQQQKSVILDIDMQGVLQLQAIKDKLDPRPCVIFVAPPNIQELEKRLRTRGTETAESIELRLQAAHKELEWGMRPNSVDFVIVNDDLDIAFDKLEEIVSKV